MSGIECPDCGSYDVVELDGVTREYQCDNCGWSWKAKRRAEFERDLDDRDYED